MVVERCSFSIEWNDRACARGEREELQRSGYKKVTFERKHDERERERGFMCFGDMVRGGKVAYSATQALLPHRDGFYTSLR